MPDVFGSLAQSNPAANVLTDAYTCPAAKRATIEAVMCNQSGAADIRLAIAPGGVASVAAHFMLFDFPLAANDAKVTPRLTVKAGDVVRVQASTATVSFNINGIEEDG